MRLASPWVLIMYCNASLCSNRFVRVSWGPELVYLSPVSLYQYLVEWEENGLLREAWRKKGVHPELSQRYREWLGCRRRKDSGEINVCSLHLLWHSSECLQCRTLVLPQVLSTAKGWAGPLRVDKNVPLFSKIFIPQAFEEKRPVLFCQSMWLGTDCEVHSLGTSWVKHDHEDVKAARTKLETERVGNWTWCLYSWTCWCGVGQSGKCGQFLLNGRDCSM